MLASATSAASSALARGRTNARPSRSARQVIARAPRTGRSSPVSESSPANSYSGNASTSSWCEAARMPSAMGKSNRPLSLRSSAGARLTVMRRAGNSKREFTSAARFQLGEFCADAREYLGLDLELCARRQVELGERDREQRLHILLYILGRARGEEFADPRAQFIEYAGPGHRACVFGRV